MYIHVYYSREYIHIVHVYIYMYNTLKDSLWTAWCTCPCVHDLHSIGLAQLDERFETVHVMCIIMGTCTQSCKLYMCYSII